MIPSLSITFMFISALICFVGPFVIASIIKGKGFSTWRIFFIGMLGFFITQVLIRIPLLQIVSTQNWFITLSDHMVLYFGFLALTAGLFETFGRFMVFKWFIKRHQDYHDGFMAGLGHGGIEAILLVGFSYISNIATSLLINMDMSDALVSGEEVSEAAIGGLNETIQLLSTTPSAQFLIGGIERIFAISVHTGLSILVLEGIRRKQICRYLGIAVLFHTLLDFTSVLASELSGNVLFAEGIALLFAAVAIYYIIIAKKRFNHLPDIEPIE